MMTAVDDVIGGPELEGGDMSAGFHEEEAEQGALQPYSATAAAAASFIITHTLNPNLNLALLEALADAWLSFTVPGAALLLIHPHASCIWSRLTVRSS